MFILASLAAIVAQSRQLQTVTATNFDYASYPYEKTYSAPQCAVLTDAIEKRACCQDAHDVDLEICMEQVCELGADDWRFCNTGPDGLPRMPLDYKESPHIAKDAEQKGWKPDYLWMLKELATWVIVYYASKRFYMACRDGWFDRTCGPCCDKIGGCLGLKYIASDMEILEADQAALECIERKRIREIAAKKYAYAFWIELEQGKNLEGIRRKSVLSYYNSTIDMREYEIQMGIERPSSTSANVDVGARSSAEGQQSNYADNTMIVG